MLLLLFYPVLIMPKHIPVEIVGFLKGQTCANICCVDEDNLPYCFTCFYVFDEVQQCLYFKSQMNTHHAQLLEANGKSAGTILEDHLDKILVKGIQFRGLVKRNSIFDVAASIQYHAHYPMAVAVPGDMWTVYLQDIKFTDNSKGFGHKAHWSVNEAEAEE
ncbi:MAG: hypothetical protein BGO31_01875 [Bacteroidetes bacterium 43-16]|nr:MAG: hypothetical protein BGO31_01875 [Bacteroidetes bacterium 43-16]